MAHLVALQAYQSLPPQEQQGLLRAGTNAFIGQILLWGLLIFIVIVVISVIGYYIYNKFGLAGAIGLLTGEGTPLVCPEGTEETTAGLCYNLCPQGMTPGDGVPTMCYSNKPSGWKGTETLAHIQKSRIPSQPGSTTTKQQCLPDEVNSGGLCYKIPQDGQSWYVSAPGFIALRCPPDSNDSGTTCWYDRGAGRIPDKTPCPPGTRDDGISCWSDPHVFGRVRSAGWNGTCNSDEEKRCEGVCGASLVSCYKICPPGYNNDGLTCRKIDVGIKKTLGERQSCQADEELIDGLCYKRPRPGFNCSATNCSASKQVTSVIGTVPQSCGAGLAPGPGGLSTFCYPKCADGFERIEGDVEACLEVCPNGWKDIGVGGCEKPTFERGVGVPLTEVGVCPPGKKRVGVACMPEDS